LRHRVGAAADQGFATSPWTPIPGADHWARQMSTVLDDLDYRVTLLAGATAPEAAALSAAVFDFLGSADPDDTMIVHVITHGDQPADLDTVYAIGADGRRQESCNVDSWVRSVAAGSNSSPQTLFLLDFCRSGLATAPRWHRRPFRASNRAWVLAASAADEDAFDCSFSRAVVETLHEVAAGDFMTHPSRPTVPYLSVTARIRDIVSGRDLACGALPVQEPTGTPVDTMTAARLNLPFFPNPDYRRAAIDDALVDVEDRLAEFVREVDHLVDARHFRDRAAARWEAGRRPGLFQGRERELRELSAWMDGSTEASSRIVTGSPGVGKSAVLGVLVCAAHPVLRHPTEEVWGHLPTPAANPHLAAVHARQQSIDAIVASLAAQLSLDLAQVSAGGILEAIAAHNTTPVIVIDALDEAVEAEALCARLVVPLARARRSDGSLACRLLVGVRPWNEFRALRQAVLTAGGSVIDLDRVPASELVVSLRTYVRRMLAASSWYGSVDGQAYVGPIADGVAATLVRPDEGAAERWGGFLIARLFAEYVAHILPPVTDYGAAERLVAGIPATLPEVLEMTLRQPGVTPWMRSVLAAVAHARGEGMPPTLIRAVAPLFAPDAAEPPSVREVRQALKDGRFYLRQSADVTGTSIFRLFHQGLAEYLRDHPRDRPSVGT